MKKTFSFGLSVFFVTSFVFADLAHCEDSVVQAEPVKKFFVAVAPGLTYLADMNTMISGSAGYRLTKQVLVLAEVSGSTSYESDYGNRDKSKTTGIAVKYAVWGNYFIKGGVGRRTFEARHSDSSSGPFEDFKSIDTLATIGLGSIWQSSLAVLEPNVKLILGWELNLLQSLDRKVEYNTYSNEPLLEKNLEAKVIVGIAF